MPDHQHDLEINRLREALLRRWWAFSAILWLTIGSLSLWILRPELSMLQQHFTWTAVRYALADNRLAALGLAICLGLTVALLVSESRHILFGVSEDEHQRLEQLRRRIQQQGPKHPLWRQLHADE
jgi:hypothetical protein